MQIRQLKQENVPAIMDLLCDAFREDPYFARLFPDPGRRKEEMRASFLPDVVFCLSQGFSFGAFDGEKLISFIICFDYKRSKRDSEKEFRSIFSGSEDRNLPLPYQEQVHDRVSAMEGEVLYLLSLASVVAYQKLGIGSALVDYVLDRYPGYSLASDISNASSLGIYRKRNFDVTQIETDYYFVCHPRGKACHSCALGKELTLLVPTPEELEKAGLRTEAALRERYLPNVDISDSCGRSFFTSTEDNLCKAFAVQLSYRELLVWQRSLNVSLFEERFTGDCVYYLNSLPYQSAPLMNGKLKEMISTRSAEWAVIPDVFVSVPMQYRSSECLLEARPRPDMKAQELLRDMDFRTQYEAGIPSVNVEVDDLASFKKRIKRFYLGKVKVQIACEASVEDYKGSGEPIGAPASVDLYVSIDVGSDCAVLTWYSLSAPFLISHLLDNIIRNQLRVLADGGQTNFFDYVSDKFGLIKRGTPKMYLVIPEGRECLKPNQAASLLAAETIYPDGENFGEIIDEDILKAVKSAKGIGQYDRAIVLAHTNVVLQFTPDFCCSLKNRLAEGSITLFYMELILLEEAAIHIADREIIRLFSGNAITEPIDFLKKVDRIYDDYCRTTDFWDIQVNYPTSQKSIDMLRRAFRIKKQLVYMQRNQTQLQTVFETKCDIIDRRESKRMDVSLAIISVLAVFSAWIDGHDYIATWGDVFSGPTIHLLQRCLFLLVLLTAVYAIIHLFGNRISRLFLAWRQRKRGKN